jgi:gliding motility-associated-like protein
LTLLSCYAICMKTALLKPFLLFLFCCTVFLDFPALAQKEANNWYFGGSFAPPPLHTGPGLSFNSNPPQALINGQANGGHGHAAMSDAAGNLLFYAAGEIRGNFPALFDRRHIGMPNSNVVNHSNTSNGMANSLFVPWPGQSQKYYFFSLYLGSTRQYNSYSVVDMALNGGFGDISSSAKYQYVHDSIAFQILGVKHRNNRDYWVIYQNFNTNIFSAYLVSPGGLNLTPVVSTPAYNPGIYGNLYYSEVSPDGKTIAMPRTDNLVNYKSRIDLFNFDANTGGITYKGMLPDSTAYSVEFSPDGTKMYVTRHVPDPITSIPTYELVQYDLEAGNGNLGAIYNSAVSLFHSRPITNVASPGNSMQVGPDGKIYLIAPIDSIRPLYYLSVINRPNLIGKACRFIPNMIDVDPNNTRFLTVGESLPTFIQSYFYRPKITMQQTCFGDTAFFTLGNRAYADSVRWNFGDPASGALNKSTSFSPKHFYASPGSYNVQAIVHFNFTSDTLHQTIFVPVTITQPILGNDTILCNGDTLILNAYQPGASYEWQDSLTTDSVFVVTRPGTYWVQVTNGCGTLSDSITVNFTSPLSLQLPKDTVLCPGQTLTLQVNANGGNLLWSNASTSSTLSVTQPGIYWAELSNACGVWRDSITVSYRQPVSNKWLPRDTAFCNQSSYLINGTNPKSLSYKWQDGSKNPTFTATASGVYWLEITTICATVRDSINVTFNQFPTKRFAPDTTICTGDNFILKAPLGLSYRWNTGDSTRQISISKAGKYKVTVEIAKGCFFSDSLLVKEERCFRTAYIPNIITPNRDNLNDQFEPKGLEAGAWQLEIYSRWGTLIYKNENYTSQWPDTEVNDGTYYYLLRNKQTGKTHKGWIEVAK